MPGVGVVQGDGDGTGEGVHAFGEDGGDQVPLGGEPAGEGGFGLRPTSTSTAP